MLVGATPMGSELAPRVAARNGAAITTNCVILAFNDRGYFEVTKMILEDKVYATLETSVSKTQIVTVVPGSFDLTPLGYKKAVELVIESVEENLLPARVRHLRFIEGDPKEMDITEAEIIVAAGRGAGGLAGIQEIERLAEHLRGAVAGSRATVDQGWLPFERQIGQTGKTVSPKLFVSCGISGAFEFTAGMKDSRLIVAINNDPKAPIFRISNLSLVGDLQRVVPKIVELLEKRMEKKIE
jgi:electron transfer flavoprotein alpha subunit